MRRIARIINLNRFEPIKLFNREEVRQKALFEKTVSRPTPDSPSMTIYIVTTEDIRNFFKKCGTVSTDKVDTVRTLSNNKM